MNLWIKMSVFLNEDATWVPSLLLSLLLPLSVWHFISAYLEGMGSADRHDLPSNDHSFLCPSSSLISYINAMDWSCSCYGQAVISNRRINQWRMVWRVHASSASPHSASSGNSRNTVTFVLCLWLWNTISVPDFMLYSTPLWHITKNFNAK